MMIALVLLASMYVSSWQMVVTAYCVCPVCCGSWSGGGRTATGSDASLPGVAADPRVLPYGTVLDISGVGVRKVDDTGGAMRKDALRRIVHIDVRMKTHAEARAWGRKTMTVYVVSWKKKD